MYSQLDRRIQLQNLVACYILHNSQIFVYILKDEWNGYKYTNSLNLQFEVSTIGIPEEPVQRTQTYDPTVIAKLEIGIYSRLSSFWSLVGMMPQNSRYTA